MGFAYPVLIEELKEQALNGAYGERLRAVIEGNPDGMINGEYDLYICEECGNWQAEPKLSYYIADGKDIDYFEKKGFTKRLYTHRHRCEKCDHIMHAVELWKRPELKCPECGEILRYEEGIMWD